MSEPTPLPGPRGRGGPFRLVLGCGCLFVAVMLGLVAFMTWQFQRAVTFDPARVRAAAEEILPGAAPPAGQVDLFAMEFQGSRLVVMGDPGLLPQNSPAPGKGGEVATTYLSLSSSSPEEAAERLRKAMEERGFRAREGRVTSRQDVSFRLGAGAVKGLHVQMESERGAALEEFTLVLPGPQGQVVAMFMAPVDRIDPEDVQKFLDGLAPVAAPAPQPSASP